MSLQRTTFPGSKAPPVRVTPSRGDSKGDDQKKTRCWLRREAVIDPELALASTHWTARDWPPARTASSKDSQRHRPDRRRVVGRIGREVVAHAAPQPFLGPTQA